MDDTRTCSPPIASTAAIEKNLHPLTSSACEATASRAHRHTWNVILSVCTLAHPPRLVDIFSRYT